MLKALVIAGLLAASVLPAGAQPNPVRIETPVALRQVTRRVEPELPPAVVAASPGGLIAADVVIRPDGTVESVKIVLSPPGLEMPTIAALRQWTFSPFMVGGRATRVVTMIDIMLADPKADAERKTTNDFFATQLACQGAVATRSADSATVCAPLVTLSDALPADRVIERSYARYYQGLSLLLAYRPAEALLRFEQALEVRARRENIDADADAAGLVEMAAETQLRLKNPQAADALQQRAIGMLERAIAAVPSERERYIERLADALSRAADIKRVLGRPADARTLDDRRAGMRASTRNTPMPASRRMGETVILGDRGPLLTADDLSQLTRLLPAGKKPWLVAIRQQGAGDDLSATIFLDADTATPALRRGRVVVAFGTIAAGSPAGAAKTWVRQNFQISWAQAPIQGRDPLQVAGSDDVNRPTEIQVTGPDLLTDAEIIGALSTVRSAAAASPPATPNDVGPLYTAVQPWFIESLARDSADTLLVRLVENRTTHSRGQMVKLKRNGAGWAVAELQPWDL